MCCVNLAMAEYRSFFPLFLALLDFLRFFQACQFVCPRHEWYCLGIIQPALEKLSCYYCMIIYQMACFEVLPLLPIQDWYFSEFFVLIKHDNPNDCICHIHSHVDVFSVPGGLFSFLLEPAVSLTNGYSSLDFFPHSSPRDISWRNTIT